MDNRYSLRFESGERQGESIPIPASGLTIGRKPGNTLQITDTSISGTHAEIRVEGGAVLLRDLGSTNGTRVGAQRLMEKVDQRLASGDTIHFGTVRATFRDAQPSAAPRGDGIEIEGLDEPATPAPAVTTGPDGVDRVSAELLARSKKRSFAGGLVVLALAAAGGGLWWWLNRSGGGGASRHEVEAVPSNLLAQGYSFESDDDGFAAAEGPAAFVKSGSARRSGAVGVEVDLAAGDWALHRSPAMRVSAGQELVARAWLGEKGDAHGALGIEFSAPESAGPDAPASVTAWSAPLEAGSGFRAAEVRAVVPPPWTNARVVLLAHTESAGGSGAVQADDVSVVVAANDVKPTANVPGAALYVLGEPPASAQLVALDRALLANVSFLPAADAPSWNARPCSVRAEGNRLFVEPRDGAASTVTLRVDGALARTRLATIGADGYRTHGLEFERAGVETLLFGSGADMVRVQLATAGTVTSIAEGSAARLRVTPASKLEIQVDFSAERKEAGNLAYAARGAEQKGELGEAIAQWTKLLDGLPYEDVLVNEAEAARTRLVQQGLAELRVVQAEAERANFFRLADLYRRSRDAAAAVAAKYQKSEVEVEAKKLVAQLDGEIDALDTDRYKAERARMKSILSALEAQRATGLAAEMREYLNDVLGEKP